METAIAEKLRQQTVGALLWVAECQDACAGDHLEALRMLRVMVKGPELDQLDLRARSQFLSRRGDAIDRDRRTRAADAVRAARPVVSALCPVTEP